VIRAGLVAIGVLAIVACRPRDEGRFANDAHAQSGLTPTPAAGPRFMYPAVPGSFVDLVAGARHGVVSIRSKTKVKSGPAAMFPGTPDSLADEALGTGFLVESKGVYVVTTYKIAEAAGAELVVVLDDTTEVPAKIIGRDVDLDLALLQIDRQRLHPLTMGDSNDLQIGQWVVVLGNAFGEEVSASAGIVSSTGREAAGSLVQARGMAWRTFRMFIQTDARIHRGNSGGPLIDTAGQVVGVAVATGDRVGELSFAIPINHVRDVIGALRDHGSIARSWLGVKVKPVTTELAQSLGLPAVKGAWVTEVVPASPAIRSALRVGDVILAWGETQVDHRTLPWIVAGTPVGKSMQVTIWRNRTELPLAVVTEKMPE
jgi:serine protease Do